MSPAAPAQLIRRTGTTVTVAGAAGVVVLGLLTGTPARADQTPVPRLVDAQVAGNDAFLSNGYVEAGIGNDGTFGTTSLAPQGYHPRGSSNLLPDVTDHRLGLRADRDKDGWGVGADDGDFVVAGATYETWGYQVGADSAIFANRLFDTTPGVLVDPWTDGGEANVTWTASTSPQGVQITQSTVLPAGANEVRTTVTFENGTGDTIPQLHYARIIDPDNCANATDAPCAGSFDTTNTVQQQRSAGDPVSAVSASTADGSYLELRSSDPDTVVAVSHAWNELTTIAAAYANPQGFGLKTAKGTQVTSDSLIYLLARTGPIPAGGSASLTFSYLLSAAEAGVELPTPTTTPEPEPSTVTTTVTETTTAPPVTTTATLTTTETVTTTETTTQTTTQTTTAPPVTTTATVTTTAPPVTTSVPTTVTETTTAPPITVTATGPTTTVASTVTSTVTSTVAPPAAVPAAPGNVVAKGTDNKATVTFGVPDSGGTPITGYQYRLGTGPWKTATTSLVRTATRTLGIGGLTNGTTYSIQVRALNTAGPGAPSSPVKVFVNSPAPKITTPRNAVRVPSKPHTYRGSKAYTVARWTTRTGSPAPAVGKLDDHALVKGEAATLATKGTFALNSAKLTATGRADVKRLARHLNAATAVRCEGYTDYTGRENTHTTLGTARAKAVCTALKNYGAKVTTTITNQRGKRPAILGSTASARHENRRVVVLVTADRR